MKISNELLAAYAENNVSKEERNQVRQYLKENPSELESVMMMMDEDYEMEVGQTPSCNIVSLNEQAGSDFCIGMAAKRLNPDSNFSFKGVDTTAMSLFPESATKLIKKQFSFDSKSNQEKKLSFNGRMNQLLDELLL